MEKKNGKKKRYYTVNEKVWIVADKKEGTIMDINKESHEVTVNIQTERTGENKVLKMWEIDKLKDFKKKPKKEEKPSLVLQGIDWAGALPDVTGMVFQGHGGDVTRMYTDKEVARMAELLQAIMYPVIYFAKVRESAIIPSKRKEDAGYDIYANALGREVEEDGKTRMVYEIECPVLATTLVPTGLATALPDTHYLNLKHERGSTGVQSMSVLAGVVDSGYRDEMFIALTPLRKAVIITSEVTKVEENETHILYPYSKAIAQGTLDLVPDATVKELTYEALKEIKSERGMGKLGDSGK